jgi:hypothetical protein
MVAGGLYGERQQLMPRVVPPVLAAYGRGRPLRRLRREAEDDEACGERRLAAGPAALPGVVDRDRPVGDLAGCQGFEDRLPGHRCSVRVEQAQPGPTGPHDDIGPGRQNLPQRRRAGVAALAQCHVAGPPSRAPEALGAPVVGQLEAGEAAGHRVVGRVQSPS